jgi:hypothetical protein
MKWVAIHFLLRHGIKLLEFGSFPVTPVGELAELATSETTKTFLF